MTHQQNSVLVSIFLAAIISTSAVALPIYLDVFSAGEVYNIEDRLGRLCRMLVLLCFPLYISIGSVAHHRFFSKQDIDGAGLSQASDALKIKQAILQNTLEQTLFAVMIYSAWAVLAQPDHQPILLLTTFLFGLGRILFAVTYSKGAAARAFGFGLTFYPTLALLIALLLTGM